jgi:hypothetical protein
LILFALRKCIGKIVFLKNTIDFEGKVGGFEQQLSPNGRRGVLASSQSVMEMSGGIMTL